jgi:hypothetical protein
VRTRDPSAFALDRSSLDATPRQPSSVSPVRIIQVIILVFIAYSSQTLLSPSVSRYGRRFDWQFDMQEKAYILEGSATLTADEPDIFGPPVTIEPRDMVQSLPFPPSLKRVGMDALATLRLLAYGGEAFVRLDQVAAGMGG